MLKMFLMSHFVIFSFHLLNSFNGCVCVCVFFLSQNMSIFIVLLFLQL